MLANRERAVMNSSRARTPARQTERHVCGLRAHFFLLMTGHYERERDAQTRIEAQLTDELAHVDVRDVELDEAKQVLRVFIAHPQGVSLELCAAVNAVAHDMFPDLALEVSSPGFEPALRSPRHFSDAVGARVKLRVRGSKKPFVATITAASDHELTVQREDETVQTVALVDVGRAHLLEPLAVAPAVDSAGVAASTPLGRKAP